jgi:hypothetical protein
MNENDTKIVRFHNIFDFDFTPEMGAMYGGIPYFVAAGGSLLCPMTLADHLATHLARHSIIQKAPVRDETEVDGKGKDRPLWNDETIAQIKTKLITDAYTEDKPRQMSDAQQMQARVKALQETFPDAPTAVEPTKAYADKAEVIEALKEKGIKFDARAAKATLEKLLTN